MPSILDERLVHDFEFESIRIVPETHRWPVLDDHPTVYEPVPVVDLTGANVVQELAWACANWGAFHLIGHGIQRELLDRVEAETRRLFALPVAQKLKAARPAGGVSGYGLARISNFFSKLMWSEGFTIAGSPVADACKLWPQEPYTFCNVMDEYKVETEHLARRLLQLILFSLGVEEHTIHEQLSSVLQMNSYPSCPDPDRAMGLAAHTDSSLLTVLYQSNTSGLQLLRPQDDHQPARWVTVKPMQDALVINVGDLLQILTNGKYKSVIHRAVVNRNSHRISVACICGPPAPVKVCPVGGKEARTMYRAVTWQEYLGIKAKWFDKALAYMMINENGCMQ